jgi:prophage regulatory protein
MSTRTRTIWRRQKVRAATGYADRTIDRKERAGQFPTRVKLGPNAVGWYSDEVEEWIESRERGGCEAPAKAATA